MCWSCRGASTALLREMLRKGNRKEGEVEERGGNEETEGREGEEKKRQGGKGGGEG